jgi:hypothetical protein
VVKRYVEKLPRENGESVGFPVKPFLYTLDQIASMINVDLKTFKLRHVHYDRRSVGFAPSDKFLARNINPDGEAPEWRIAEREAIRWMKFMGFRVYERGWPEQ